MLRYPCVMMCEKVPAEVLKGSEDAVLVLCDDEHELLDHSGKDVTAPTQDPR